MNDFHANAWHAQKPYSFAIIAAFLFPCFQVVVMSAMSDRTARLHALQQALQERILILDGGMGTMIQSYKLEEEDYRGEMRSASSCIISGSAPFGTIWK